jgi:ribosomal protein S18 acetylase RimI-like enzyme
MTSPAAVTEIERTFTNPRIADLRSLRAHDLSPLLLDETIEWRRELDWDYSKSADLVRRFADGPGLTGVALLDGGEVAGYAYAGFEGHKGLIWDVYVRPGWRSGNAEVVLFRLLLDALIETSRVRRIECQLMLVEPASAKTLQRERFVRLFERVLMTRNITFSLPAGRASTIVKSRFERWSDNHYDAAATVLSLAYTGHVDSQFNDRYRTFAGAMQFLHELVQFPGCSTFCQEASWLAFDESTGQVAGVALSSFIAGDVAHIAELCVMPEARGAGLGYELLRRSVEASRSAGAKRISLTVTAANDKALALYARCGFREIRRFYACVWEAQ